MPSNTTSSMLSVTHAVESIKDFRYNIIIINFQLAQRTNKSKALGAGS